MKIFRIIGHILCIIGLMFLFWVDWRIAIGVLLFMLGDYTENTIERLENNIKLLDDMKDIIKGAEK